MSWIERGGPEVLTPTRSGFGSTVIKSMARHAVGGDVRLECAPEGLEWHSTCPAHDALERGGDGTAPRPPPNPSGANAPARGAAARPAATRRMPLPSRP